MQNVIHQTSTVPTHGDRISIAADTIRIKLLEKELHGLTPKLSKTERLELTEHIAQDDMAFTHRGVNFSRLNLRPLFEYALTGGKIEFEALGPYLQAYQIHNGLMTPSNLLKEDAIGLELAVVFRQFFPRARLISLYDDYNAHIPGISVESSGSGIAHFSDTAKQTFYESLITLYKSSGALTDKSIDGVDYLLIPESSKVADAQALVARLDTKGYIQRKGEEIIFVNNLAENPLHHRIHLRNSKGKWLCEALDAATFLKEENLDILHIIALPDYMRSQQDRVWEILRILGISSYRYHNIFYSTDFSPEDVSQTVTDVFNQYLQSQAQEE